MSISVNPILPVIAAQGAAPDLVLQPGSVVDAEVLKILSDDLVRIAIASLSIDVLSEIPLAAGQALQLAVSQTPDGIRLAVVGQGAGSAASADTVTLPPNAPVDAAAGPPLSAALPRNILTPLEQVAVAAAAESAATQQDSLAPLFANLGVVAGSNSLPPKLQQAVMQVLAQQTSLDQNLTGSDVRNAVQKSGLFLEASLASGSVSLASGMPDLKAALIVLRQALVSSLGAAAATQNPATPVTAMPTPATAARRAGDRCTAARRAGDCRDFRRRKRGSGAGRGGADACPLTGSRHRGARDAPAAGARAGRRRIRGIERYWSGSCSPKRCSTPGLER